MVSLLRKSFASSSCVRAVQILGRADRALIFASLVVSMGLLYPAAVCAPADKEQSSSSSPANLRPVELLRKSCFKKIAQHQEDEALSDIAGECRKNHGDLEKHDLYVVILSSCHKTEQALSIAKQMVAEHPDQSQSWLTLGWILSYEGEMQLAVSAYTDGIQRTADPKLYLGRASVYNSLKQYDKAVQDAEMVLASLPDSVEALKIRASSNKSRSRLKEAISDYERLKRLQPGNWMWSFHIVSSLDEHQQEKARSCFDTEVKQQPKSYCDMSWSYAQYWKRIHQPEESLKVVDEFLALVTRSPHLIDYRPDASAYMRRFLDLRRELYEQLGKERELLEIVTSNCARQPHDVLSWLTRFDLLIRLRQTAAARDTLNDAINKNPRCTLLLLKRAELLEGTDENRCLEDLDRVLAYDPDCEQAIRQRLKISRAHKELQHCLVDAKKLVSLRPDGTTEVSALIDCLILLGRYTEALDQAKLLVESHPVDVKAWRMKLCVLYSMGRWDELRAELEQVRRKNVFVTVQEIACRCVKAGYTSKKFEDVVNQCDSGFNKAISNQAGKADDAPGLVQKVESWRYAAQLNIANGEYLQALNCCNEGLALSPRDHRLYLCRAAACFGLHQPDKAADDRRRALELYQWLTKKPQ